MWSALWETATHSRVGFPKPSWGLYTYYNLFVLDKETKTLELTFSRGTGQRQSKLRFKTRKAKGYGKPDSETDRYPGRHTELASWTTLTFDLQLAFN